MATATLITPSAHYQPQPSFTSTYPHSTASIANMISSTEPRKSADDNEPSNRQSLPSISEVIQGAKPHAPYPPAPPAVQPGSGLPSPFSAGPRPFSDADKHASPQPLHPSTFPPRQDPLPAFSDSPRPPFNNRPSLPPVSDRRPSPTSKPDVPPHHHSEQQKPPEPHHHMNGAYGHPPPPPPPPAPMPYQPGQLPPGQMPLPGYPISPRHAVPPHVPGPYDPRAPPHVEEAEYSRARYDATVNRHFESWNYQDSLSRIGSASRTIFNFAEAYSRIAQEQHGAHPIPERLPTEREVNEMLGNMEHIKRSLEQVRDLVQTSIQNERAREGAKMKGYEEEHDVPMYGDGMKPQYGITEVKKRRGRAAPPGRCHSCNRIDTPEWRRGPDGARTLCNACGLHYAKLERKRQLEARSIRPKPDEAIRP